MSKKIKLKDLLEENFSIAGGVVSQNAFNDNMSLELKDMITGEQKSIQLTSTIYNG